MNYLANAFSLQMLAGTPAVPVIEKIDITEIPADIYSCIGHEDTAILLSEILNSDIKVNRESITIRPDDTLYVAQLSNGRLKEGTTTLSAESLFKFFKVKVIYDDLCIDKNGKVCSSILPCACNCTYIF